VIAWLWARTVVSPNPAVDGIHVPLISNFFSFHQKGKRSLGASGGGAVYSGHAVRRMFERKITEEDIFAQEVAS
jgi:hypothetical protein